MKNVKLLVFLFFCSFFVYGQTDSLDLFEFSSENTDVGNMYTYSLGNIDKSEYITMYVYMTSDHGNSVLKDYSSVIPMVLYINSEFNYEYFVFDNTEAGNPFFYMKVPFSNKTSVGSWNFSEMKSSGEMTYFGVGGKEKRKAFNDEVNMFPSFDLSLFQLDFVFAMKHYIGDKSDFEVGSMYGGHTYNSIVSFEKEEMVNSILCDKWVVRGKGILAKINKVKQELWLAKDNSSPYLIQYKNHMRISPFKNIHITLNSIQSMTEEEWALLVDKTIEDVRVKLAFPLNE